jgi:hypothetical protein
MKRREVNGDCGNIWIIEFSEPVKKTDIGKIFTDLLKVEQTTIVILCFNGHNLLDEVRFSAMKLALSAIQVAQLPAIILVDGRDYAIAIFEKSITLAHSSVQLFVQPNQEAAIELARSLLKEKCI